MRFSSSAVRRKSWPNSPSNHERICEAVRYLGENHRPPLCAKLTGRNGWRIRVGDYRVIYEIDDNKQIVTVLHVGLRKDVYRK